MTRHGLPPLVRRERPAEIPLSFAQSRLWFLNRLDGARPNYNEQVALHFAGPFDCQAMIAALRDLVDRHETLRTVFPQRGGVPHQAILPAGGAVVQRTVATTAEELRAAMAAATDQGFDLTTEPPLRAWVFVVAPDVHVLLLVIHHVAVDGWSIQRVLVRDLLRAYESRKQGRAPAWPELPVQYADYALWQEPLLRRGDDPGSPYARHAAFWAAALKGLPDEIALPADRRRPAVPSFGGRILEFDIAEPLHVALIALARRGRATVFMALHAALAALLSRLGCGVDIPIGSPVSGRTHTVLQDLVGFFANTVVIRSDVSGNPSFGTLLERVRRTVLAACAHDELPFERVVDVVKPVRSLSRNPLFQVLLAFQTVAPAAGAQPAEGRMRRLRMRAATRARFDLSFDFIERRAPGKPPRGIHGTLEYSVDLFDRPTAERIVRRLLAVLEAVSRDWERPIAHIDILLDGEREQLLHAWGTGTARPAQGPPVIDRFERMAAARPAAPAVSCEDRRLTYGELDEQANRLARHLLARGIGPGSLVGIAVPRSVELPICRLAVLKAGAACLLLDPDHPARHLALVLADAAPCCTLATRDTARTLPRNASLIVLDDAEVARALAGGDAGEPGRGHRPVVASDAAAYVAYTSGRSGAPRGVVVTHQGMCAVLSGLETALDLTDANTFVALSSLGADLSMLELLQPLTIGAELVLASADELLYPRLVARSIGTLRSPVVQGTARGLRALARHLYEPVPGLTFLAGRDSVLTPDVRSALESVAHRVVHLYGTTETTIWSTFGPADRDASGRSPIGGPLDETRVYVLDDRLEPLPAGVIGDLYVGGSGVARGYVGPPSMTAERFVADPFGCPDARMFRTGDRARWRPDGTLELVAPRDDSVRADDRLVVEAALRANADVADAVVLARDGAAGQPNLLAYAIVPNGRGGEDLDGFLERTLPAPLVPRDVVALDSLPLTPNGTLDRAALPEPIVRSRASGEDESPERRALCALFAEVLGVSSVGLDDNFFALGGDSLLVIKLINRARTQLGLDMNIRMLFDAPTVSSLSRRLEKDTSDVR